MKVFVLRGIPGSGKSTLAHKLKTGVWAVCSADTYFYDHNGNYQFDPAKLPEAHRECLYSFTKLLTGGNPPTRPDVDTIIVDNTNLTAVEMAPYVAIALAYNAELQIVNVHCDPVVAAARCLHGVPESKVKRMAETMLDEKLPPWWLQYVVDVF